jgi:hypothetical protein
MLEGRVELVSEPPSFDSADVHVWVEDTTYVDAPAVRISQQVIPHASHASLREGIPFRLELDRPVARGRTRTIAALVDLDGDGRAGRGDFISFESIRVPDDNTFVRVRVKRIE